jgi:predicted secreted protein
MMTVAEGQPFDIELTSTPSSGYVWELAPPESVRLLATEFHPAPDSQIGGPGSQVFRLTTDRSGRFELHFQLKRRWESKPIETHDVEVLASPQPSG